MDHSSWYNPRGPMKLLEWQLQINDPCAMTLQQNRHLVRKDSWFTPAIDYKPCNTGGRAPHDPQKSLSMNPPIQLSCPSLVCPPAKTQMERGNHHSLIHQYNSCPKTKPYEMTKPGRTTSAIGDWYEVICPTNLDDNHETSSSSQKITTSATGTQIFFKSNPGPKLELRLQWSLSGAWLQSHKSDANQDTSIEDQRGATTLYMLTTKRHTFKQRGTKLRNQNLTHLLSSSWFSPFLAAPLGPGCVDGHYLHNSLSMFPEAAQKVQIAILLKRTSKYRNLMQTNSNQKPKHKSK